MLLFVVSVVRASFCKISLSDTRVLNDGLASTGVGVAFSCLFAIIGAEFIVFSFLNFSLDAGHDQCK